SSVDFPTTPGVIQEKAGKRHCIEGCTDAFVSKIAPSGSALVYSTYLYGELDDNGSAIAVDGASNAYVVGTTNSLLFPILHAFQPRLAAGVCDVFGTAWCDAFRAKISAGGPGVPPAVDLTVSPTAVAPGGTLIATWAGNPTPTASDYLRLFALGSAGDEFDDP